MWLLRYRRINHMHICITRSMNCTTIEVFNICDEIPKKVFFSFLFYSIIFYSLLFYSFAYLMFIFLVDLLLCMYHHVFVDEAVFVVVVLNWMTKSINQRVCTHTLTHTTKQTLPHTISLLWFCLNWFCCSQLHFTSNIHTTHRRTHANPHTRTHAQHQ